MPIRQSIIESKWSPKLNESIRDCKNWRVLALLCELTLSLLSVVNWKCFSSEYNSTLCLLDLYERVRVTINWSSTIALSL